ncbi:MAG: tetratricopeptide repeat protein [Acidobacteriota bacterium]
MHRRHLCVALVLALLCAWSAAGSAAERGMLTASEARRQAAELKNSGVRAYQEGRLADAIRDLSAAIDINLNDFFSYYTLGLALRDTARYAQAREMLEVAAELDPGYLQVYVALGDVALGQGDPAAAQARFQKSLNRQANYSPALDGLGRIALARGDLDGAIGKFREAIKANHGFPLPYIHLGEIYRSQGRQDDAVDLFRRAIRFRPDFGPAYRYLGVTFGELGRRNEAATFLREAIRLQPEDVDVRLALAQLLLDWGDAHRAREQFEAARGLAPHRHEPLLGLARVARRAQDYEAALALLRQAAGVEGLEESEHLSILNLIVNYDHERKRRQALLEAADDVESAVDAATARVALARIRHEAADLHGALTLCESSLDDLSRPAGLVFECGYYALVAREYGRAVELLGEATRLDPSRPRVLVDLGLAYAGTGRLASAVESYQKALQIEPESAEASTYLGNAHLRLGDLDGAEEAYRSALRVVDDPATIDRLQRALAAIEERRVASLTAGGPDGDPAATEGDTP